MKYNKPPCEGCRSNRLRVIPEYSTCKEMRLCDLVDPGLLLLAYHLESVEEYKEAHNRLLRGMFELEMRRLEPWSTSESGFVEAILDAHRTLFAHALPHIAGRFRIDGEDVTFGGIGANKREGAAPGDIEAGVKSAFKLAMKADWTVERRSAAFLEKFFRVHPFLDGNGRVARFFVQKICRAEGKQIPLWHTEGKSRRKYLSALEYAHRHYLDKGEQALYYLEAWLRQQIVTADEGDPQAGLVE